MSIIVCKILNLRNNFGIGMLNTLYNADLNQKQNSTPPQVSKNCNTVPIQDFYWKNKRNCGVLRLYK